MQLKQYRIHQRTTESECNIGLFIDGALVAEYNPYFSSFSYVGRIHLHYIIPFLVWLSRYSCPSVDIIEQELINTGWTKR